MRKTKFIIAMLLAIAVVLVAIGCDKPTLESISFKERTVAVTVEQGEKLDTSKAVILAHYSDGSQKEIKAGDPELTFSEFSTAEAGKFTLIASYKGLTCPLEIEVKAKDVYAGYSITKVELPEFVSLFRDATAEKSDKHTEFYVRDNAYCVGDDNVFEFKPIVTVENNGESVDDDILDAAIKVEVMGVDGTYSYVPAEQYVEVVSYGRYKFKEAALDKQIKFTVRPFIIDRPESSKGSINFEFTVVDGWNAYSAIDLAMIEADRVATDESDREIAADWEKFKQERGLPLTKVNAVILQSNIAITKDDLPSSFFYSREELDPTDADFERAVGSLKDKREIFARGVLPDERFQLIGNCFTVNASAMPLVVRGEQTAVKGVVLGGSSLIGLENNGDVSQGSSIGSAIIKDVCFVGNSNRSGDGALAGGLINHKAGGVNFRIENCITSKWIVTYFHEEEGSGASYDIYKCRSYDNYNSFIYAMGGGNYVQEKFITVDDSEMIGAGGPVMICDYSLTSDGDVASNVKVTNSKLESFLSGSEGWFGMFGATELFRNVIKTNRTFVSSGRTYLKHNDISGKDEFNFIALFRSNDDPYLSDLPTIKGYLSIDDNAALDFGQGNNILRQHLQALGEQRKGDPVFMSAAGGIGYFDGTSIKNFANGNKVVPAGDALFEGDYLNMYVGDMINNISNGYIGLTLGYYPSQDR